MSATDDEKSLLEIEKLRLEIEKERVELLQALNAIEDWNKETGFSVINRRVVRLTAAIDDESVGLARQELYDIARLYPGQSITLDVNSPGGTVSAGLELFGVLRELSEEGHQIITRITGEACSMGGVVVQAGDIRQIRKRSYLHIHEASWGAIGKASEMRESADHIERITKDLAAIYAEKSHLSVDAIYERMHRREWWMSAQEALDNGFVDEVV